MYDLSEPVTETAAPLLPASRPKRKTWKIVLFVLAGVFVLGIGIPVIAVIFVVAQTWDEVEEAANPVKFAVPYQSAEGHYSISFPAKPTVDGEQVTWEGLGNLVLISQAIPLDGSGSPTPDQLDTILSDVLDGMPSSFKGSTLVDKKWSQLDGARAITGTLDGKEYDLHVVISINRGYQYVLLATTDQPKLFFDTFKFTS